MFGSLASRILKTTDYHSTDSEGSDRSQQKNDREQLYDEQRRKRRKKPPRFRNFSGTDTESDASPIYEGRVSDRLGADKRKKRVDNRQTQENDDRTQRSSVDTGSPRSFRIAPSASSSSPALHDSRRSSTNERYTRKSAKGKAVDAADVLGNLIPQPNGYTLTRREALGDHMDVLHAARDTSYNDRMLSGQLYGDTKHVLQNMIVGGTDEETLSDVLRFMEEDIRRREILTQSPVYKFMLMLAGFTNLDLGKLIPNWKADDQIGFFDGRLTYEEIAQLESVRREKIEHTDRRRVLEDSLAEIENEMEDLRKTISAERIEMASATGDTVIEEAIREARTMEDSINRWNRIYTEKLNRLRSGRYLAEKFADAGGGNIGSIRNPMNTPFGIPTTSGGGIGSPYKLYGSTQAPPEEENPWEGEEIDKIEKKIDALIDFVVRVTNKLTKLHEQGHFYEPTSLQTYNAYHRLMGIFKEQRSKIDTSTLLSNDPRNVGRATMQGLMDEFDEKIRNYEHLLNTVVNDRKNDGYDSDDNKGSSFSSSSSSSSTPLSSSRLQSTIRSSAIPSPFVSKMGLRATPPSPYTSPPVGTPGMTGGVATTTTSSSSSSSSPMSAIPPSTPSSTSTTTTTSSSTPSVKTTGKKDSDQKSTIRIPGMISGLFTPVKKTPAAVKTTVQQQQQQPPLFTPGVPMSGDPNAPSMVDEDGNVIDMRASYDAARERRKTRDKAENFRAEQRMRLLKLELETLESRALIVQKQLEIEYAKGGRGGSSASPTDVGLLIPGNPESWTVSELRRHNLLLPRVESYMKRREMKRVIDALMRPNLTGIVEVSPKVYAACTKGIGVVSGIYFPLANVTLSHFVNNQSHEAQAMWAFANLVALYMNETEILTQRKQTLEKTRDWLKEELHNLNPWFERMYVSGSSVSLSDRPITLMNVDRYMNGFALDPMRSASIGAVNPFGEAYPPGFSRF